MSDERSSGGGISSPPPGRQPGDAPDAQQAGASPSPSHDQADRQGGRAPDRGPEDGGDAGLQDARELLGKALVELARAVVRHGRSRARRAAESGRVRLDLRQLRRDRDVMVQKLGREVVRLVEGGEVDHPGLVRGVERIRDIERRIAELEAEAAAKLDDVSLEPAPSGAPVGEPDAGA